MWQAVNHHARRATNKLKSLKAAVGDPGLATLEVRVPGETGNDAPLPSSKERGFEVMPVVAIQVGVEYSRQQELAIVRAVSTAMTRVLKIQEEDIDARLFVREPHRFPLPPGKGEQYTLVIIDLFGGCPIGAGTSLYRSIVTNLCLLLIPADHIRVVLHEVERDDWGSSTGMAASEVAGYATKLWAPSHWRVRRGAPMGWLRLLAQMFGLQAGPMRDS